MKEKLGKLQKLRDKILMYTQKYIGEKETKVSFDKWNIKDLIAHLNNWMDHDIECINALKAEKEPYWEMDIDDFNRRGIKKRNNMTFENLCDEFVALSDNLIHIYKNLPGELWNKLIWKDENQTLEKFVDDDIAHWREHLEEIRKKIKYSQ